MARTGAVTASLIVSAALAAPAQALLAPEYYEEARRTAASHVQIAVESVEAPSGGMGDCPVEGSIVRVFRGTLRPGDRIAFNVSCYDYGSIPSGATLWTDYDALNQARYLEAFMSADVPPRVVLDQVEIILSPRDRPYCDAESLRCESTVDGSARLESCSIAGRVWDWLGLGGGECE